MDDGYGNCKDRFEFVKLSLDLTGFIFSGEHFKSVQCLEWLKLIWGSNHCTLKVPK